MQFANFYVTMTSILRIYVQTFPIPPPSIIYVSIIRIKDKESMQGEKKEREREREREGGALIRKIEDKLTNSEPTED